MSLLETAVPSPGVALEKDTVNYYGVNLTTYYSVSMGQSGVAPRSNNIFTT